MRRLTDAEKRAIDKRSAEIGAKVGRWITTGIGLFISGVIVDIALHMH